MKGNLYNLIAVLHQEAETIPLDVSPLCSDALVTYQTSSTVRTNKGISALWGDLNQKNINSSEFLVEAAKLMDEKFTQILNETIA